MSGLLSVCGGHLTTRATLESAWTPLNEAGILNGAINSDLHSVMDVVTFFMHVLRVRRERSKKISDGLRRLVAEVTLPMLQWVAETVDSYVLRVYSEDNAQVHLAPPSIVHGGCGAASPTRKYVVVSPEAAWDVMEKALAARANVEQAIRLKDDEASLGCSSSQAEFGRPGVLRR